MRLTRRAFTRRLGIALASLAMSGCIPGRGRSDSPRDRLRDCWLRFDWLAERTKGSDERGNKAATELVTEHRTALDAEVAAGSLDPAVADQVQAAFAAAVYHVWRSNASITCYEPVLVDYTPTSSGQLARQAELLAELAEKGDLDPATVAQAQAAIERDIAFLNLHPSEVNALYEGLIAAAGGAQAIPSFDEIDLEIAPEAAEATRYLVALLQAE